MVQTQLNQLSEALIQAGEPDKYGLDGQAMHNGMRNAIRDFRAKLIEAVDAMLPDTGTKKQKFNLSLIENEQMQVQLRLRAPGGTPVLSSTQRIDGARSAPVQDT